MQGFRELIQLHLAEQAGREASRNQDELLKRMERMLADVATARAMQGAAEEEIKRIHLERRKIELDVQGHEGTRRKYRDQLMTAKTNEIYKTLLHEIEHEGGKISALETLVLEMMESADRANATIESAKKKVAEAEGLRLAEEKKLQADIEALEAEKSGCAARAAELAQHVQPAQLSLYRRICDQRGGKGMAQIKDLQCTECHVGVRPQAWVDLLGTQDPATCSGCKRLLYREENLRPDAGAPAAAS